MNKTKLVLLTLFTIVFLAGIYIIVVSFHVSLSDITHSYARERIDIALESGLRFNSLMSRYKIIGLVISVVGGTGVIMSLFDKK